MVHPNTLSKGYVYVHCQNCPGCYFLATKVTVAVFKRDSRYCFQRVLAISILSVRLSVTRVDQTKTVQATIIKFSRLLPGRL